jgi:2-oxoglutarate ferredoxin oxidoreductase subunit delta
VAKGRVSIVVERCKACGFCVEFCPTKVLALSSAFNSKGYHPPHVVNPEKCSGCDLCGMYCPDFAIYGYKLEAGQAHVATAASAVHRAQRGPSNQSTGVEDEG